MHLSCFVQSQRRNVNLTVFGVSAAEIYVNAALLFEKQKILDLLDAWLDENFRFHGEIVMRTFVFAESLMSVFFLEGSMSGNSLVCQ
jgi:hypothetical protein